MRKLVGGAGPAILHRAGDVGSSAALGEARRTSSADCSSGSVRRGLTRTPEEARNKGSMARDGHAGSVEAQGRVYLQLP
ncbi:MAG: hypothetical protein M1815_005860 [Lichina confinis]|nr:MAG: hypothetical protein M1815_005860 [Lichina confinis]